MIEDLRLVECEILKRTLLPSSEEHNFHLFYVFSGSGLLIVDSSSYTCNCGFLLLFSSLEVAVTQPSIHDTLSILHISFTCNSYALGAELRKLPHVLSSPRPVHNIFFEIFHEYVLQNKMFTDLCSLYLEHVLVSTIISLIRDSDKLQSPYHMVNLTNNLSLDSACAYINQNLDSELSLSTLCDMTHCSPKHLNAQFQKLFQESVTEYISNSRHKKARELLFFSDYSITEISEKVGFRSVHYFSKKFKEKEGLSPTQYRKNFLDSCG